MNNSTWVDANVPPGISVTAGSNVYYRFNVTNTGNVVLSNITLTGNTYNLSGATVPSSLAPNASFVYYLGPVQAQVGQHTDTATATGKYNNKVYCDTDNANYNGTCAPTPTPKPTCTPKADLRTNSHPNPYCNAKTYLYTTAYANAHSNPGTSTDRRDELHKNVP